MRAGIFKGRLGTALVILAALTMLGSACGPSEAPPAAPAQPPPTPGGNQPPVISSFTPAQTQVYPSGTTEIQCVASDADGDKIEFVWACTGGSFTGIGQTVTWKAPENYGNYDITVNVKDGKGGIVQATLTMGVTANNAPQISSMVANPSTILFGSGTTITCVASDPDGDVVRYSWSADEGSITGVGEKVTWIAPNRDGNFNITVVVSDGKGGDTTGNVMVAVSASTKTVTINPVAQETGTVSSEGDRDTSKIWAGDDDENVGYCAFWSFDIWSLVGKKIESAKLTFTTRNTVNDPFSKTTGLNGLRIWKVNYGDNLPDFQYTGSKLNNSVPTVYEPPTVIDVTPEINQLVQATSTRFQVEALFLKPYDGDGVAEWIEWSEVSLTVTYSEK